MLGRRIKLFAFAGVVVSLGFVVILPPSYETLREEAASRILTAVQASGRPPWAGRYTDSSGRHGAHVVLHLSTAGFIFGYGDSEEYAGWWAGPQIEGPSGSVEQVGPDRLILRNDRHRDFLGRLFQLKGPARTLHLVRWGNRIYPVSEKRMPEFVKKVNEELGPKGWTYVDFGFPFSPSEKDWPRVDQVAGPPDVPSPWKDLLLASPVEAKVVSVGSARYDLRLGDFKRSFDVLVSAGSREGLKAGHRLFLRSYDSATPVQILEVGDSQSRGEAEQLADLEKQLIPFAGQRAASYSFPPMEWETP